MRTLQRAQAALEAADDFSGAAIVGAAAVLALKRAAVLRVLADAERGANSTTPEAPSPRADQFAAAGQWVDADDEPSFVRQAAVAESAGAEPADAIDNSGSPGWGEQQPVSSLAPLSENSTSSHRNGRPPSLQLPAAIVKEEGATSAAAPSVLRANVPSIADFQIIRPISKGAFGRVYLARKKATGDSFAVKVQRKDKALGRGASAKRVMSERDILVHADHPFVVKLFFCFQSRHNLYLVMEYLAGGDLHALLKRVGFLEEQLASIYLAEIVLGLEYLHEVLGIVHRDLKPENVLLSTSGHIKLTDFGLSWARVGNVGAENRSATTDDAARASILATQSSPPSIPTAPPAPVDTSAPAAESEDAHSNSQNARASRCFSVVGSPHYVAPEVLRATGHSTPVDWWALGVIAFELLTGRLPFGNGSISNVQDSVLAGDIKWPAGKEAQRISGVARDLISRLLMLHVKERLGTVRGALEVREHDFFRAVSWADLLRHNSFYIPLPTDAEAGPGAPQPSPPSPATGGPPTSPQSPIGSPERGFAGGSGRLSFGKGSFGEDGHSSLAHDPLASHLLAGPGHPDETQLRGSGERGAGGGLRVPLEAASPASNQLLNFDYISSSNLMRINEEAKQNAGSVSHHDACKVCKLHTLHLTDAWIAVSDFEAPPAPFVDVPLREAVAEGGIELTFKENLVRITAVADERLQAERGIEVWFKNESAPVSGLTHWGTYSYARWWKGLAAQYTDAMASESVAEPLYSYAELEHEDAGPVRVLLGAARTGGRVKFCLGKAKAFGIKRTVHRISFAHEELVGKRTTITWEND